MTAGRAGRIPRARGQASHSRPRHAAIAVSSRGQGRGIPDTGRSRPAKLSTRGHRRENSRDDWPACRDRLHRAFGNNRSADIGGGQTFCPRPARSCSGQPNSGSRTQSRPGLSRRAVTTWRATSQTEASWPSNLTRRPCKAASSTSNPFSVPPSRPTPRNGLLSGPGPDTAGGTPFNDRARSPRNIRRRPTGAGEPRPLVGRHRERAGAGPRLTGSVVGAVRSCDGT